MKIVFLISLFFVIVLNSIAQESLAPAESSKYDWKHSLVAGMTLTQVAFTDWVKVERMHLHTL